MKLNNKVYDVLKWIAQILLPALGTLYFALGKVWDLPYVEGVTGTIVALDTFLGAILGISSVSYHGEGSLIVNQTDPDSETLSVSLNENLEDIVDRKYMVLKIEK